MFPTLTEARAKGRKVYASVFGSGSTLVEAFAFLKGPAYYHYSTTKDEKVREQKTWPKEKHHLLQ